MKKLYNFSDEAKCAYLLKNGAVYFEIKDKELYKISGKNLVVAASEPILNFDKEKCYYRVFSLYTDDGAELIEILPDALNKLMYKYAGGYNANVFCAQMIKITNKIIVKRQAMLTDDVKAVHEISRVYFTIASSMVDLARKTRFPDLAKASEALKNEIIYEIGKAFHQKEAVKLEVEKEKLDDFNISYSPNSIICKEGEEGNEMYILNKGRIGVLINEEQVAEIDEPGTVIGEIALLLGETRTATLKATDQTILSIVKKENLTEFHKNHEDFFLRIGKSLSERIYNNFQIIRNIDKQEKAKTDEKVAGFLTISRAKDHLIKLEERLSRIYADKRYKQLSDLIKMAEDAIKRYIG